MRDLDKAINKLRLAGIAVTATDYGFSLQHGKIGSGDFGQCGMDNDSSISISLHTDEDPPALWFFRKDFMEMAEFIAKAYELAKTDKAMSRASIVMALREIDKGYDETELRKMTAAFLNELENDT